MTGSFSRRSGQELLPPRYRRNGTLEGTNKSVILRSHLPLFTQTGRCHFQSHALVWADHPPPSKTRMTTITIKVLVLSLPQGLFSPSAWFLECVFCCVLQCHDRFLSPPTPMVFVAPPPPLLWLITMTRHWPKDMYIELQALETEIGCETKQTKKKWGKHIYKAKDTSMHSLRLSSHQEGGGHLCLCAECLCVNTWYTWAAAPPLTETAPGLAAQWTTPKLCVYACLRYDCLVFKLFLFCLFFFVHTI